MTGRNRYIIHHLLEEYAIQTADNIQDALGDLLGGTIIEMMKTERMDRSSWLCLIRRV